LFVVLFKHKHVPELVQKNLDHNPRPMIEEK
jgi:hypothetical protein